MARDFVLRLLRPGRLRVIRRAKAQRKKAQLTTNGDKTALCVVDFGHVLVSGGPSNHKHHAWPRFRSVF